MATDQAGKIGQRQGGNGAKNAQKRPGRGICAIWWLFGALGWPVGAIWWLVGAIWWPVGAIWRPVAPPLVWFAGLLTLSDGKKGRIFLPVRRRLRRGEKRNGLLFIVLDYHFCEKALI